MLGTLSDLLLKRRDIAEAERIQRRSLALLKAIDDKYGFAVAQAKLANILSERNQLGDAEILMSGAVDRMIALGDRHQAAFMQKELALIVFKRHDTAKAENLLREAIILFREYSEKDPRHLAESLCDLAMLLVGVNRQDEARPCFIEALELYGKVGAWSDVQKIEEFIDRHVGNVQQ